MKLFNKVSNFIAAALMLFFSIPKLLGKEQVKENFKQFESLVPIDLDIFRVFTGAVELSIGILILTYAIKNMDSIGKLGYFMLFSTMSGALVMEFVGRPKPVMMMTVIAILLLSLSIYKLKTLFAK